VTAPRDPGLQPERTELAWRRTLLSIAVGALVSVRVLPEVLGEWTIVTGLVGVALTGVLWILARRRHARVTAVFRAEAPGGRMPGGGLLLALAVLTSAGAALGMLFAVVLGR
jgi:putative membrane protein